MSISQTVRRIVTPDRLFVALLTTLGAAVVVLVWLWWLHPKSDTLGYELGKALLQLLVVTVVGSGATLVAFNYQRYRDHRRELQQRSDQLLQALMDDALASYHQVKRARRLMRARLWVLGSGDRISVRVYDEQLLVLNDAQLDFERLAAMAGRLSDPRVKSRELQQGLTGIETYLNGVISEYEKQRRTLSGDESALAAASLPKLKEFIGLPAQPFKEQVSNPMHDIADQVQAALLQQLDNVRTEKKSQPPRPHPAPR